jgi:hypothetical protein
MSMDGGSIEGSATFVDGTAARPRPLTLPHLQVVLGPVRWPATDPTPIRLSADLPEAGKLTAAGSIDLGARAWNLSAELTDAALSPYNGFIPIDAVVSGRLHGALGISGTLAKPVDLSVTGTLTGRSVALTAGDRPAITADRIDAQHVDYRWPSTLSVDRLAVSRPSLFVEREADGSLPLRAALTRAPQADGSADETAGGEASASPRVEVNGDARDARNRSFTIDLDQIVVEEGYARFVDRTTTPFYSEEISNLNVTLRGVDSATPDRAAVRVQGVVGGDAALELQGEVAPFAEPFYLELSGELRDFAVPRTNPYVRKFLDWYVQRGSLRTKVHYRIVGDQLDATHYVVVDRLAVRPERRQGDESRRLDIPLGLVVSVLKNRSGEIHLTVPVHGTLSSPQFSFGNALATAFKNVISRLVTAPFRAIGKVFRRGDDDVAPAVKIDPVEFERGTAVMTAEAQRQVQRVADFLRASPYVELEVTPVVTDADLASLRTKAVTARIQRFQREHKLDNFAEAATQLFRREYPNQFPPDTVDKIVEVLHAREPMPADAARELAARRLEITQQELIESAGISPDRLVSAGPASLGGQGDGRVEFDLRS